MYEIAKEGTICNSCGGEIFVGERFLIKMENGYGSRWCSQCYTKMLLLKLG